jgi:hypothetical protein
VREMSKAEDDEKDFAESAMESLKNAGLYLGEAIAVCTSSERKGKYMYVLDKINEMYLHVEETIGEEK